MNPFCDCDPPHFSRLETVDQPEEIRRLLIFVCPLGICKFIEYGHLPRQPFVPLSDIEIRYLVLLGVL